MFGLFNSVKPYLKPKRKVDVPRPDNLIFKLHYKVTFTILLVSTILVSSYQYIDSSGSAIQCLFEKGTDIPANVINRYCWIMSTFTLPQHYEGTAGEDFIHFGVGSHKRDDEKKYHAYYQWVPLVLSIQAIMFYAPHWIWKQLEGGRLEKIISGLNNRIYDTTQKEAKVYDLAVYMQIRMKDTKEHEIWALKFFICECLNFINVVCQIFITDSFLGGEFSTYGTEVFNFVNMESSDRVDPMSRVFPKMTKCNFYKYGGSGTLETIDALCVLGMNILNEKIYIFMWLWFIILALVTGINIVVRLVQFFMPDVRQRMTFLANLGHLNKDVPRSAMEEVVQRLSYADWLILYYLAQAMDKSNFGSLISKLVDDLPTNPYINEDGEIEMEEGKSITPPPGFDEAASEADPSLSRSATLRSPNKLKSMLSIGKKDKV